MSLLLRLDINRIFECAFEYFRCRSKSFFFPFLCLDIILHIRSIDECRAAQQNMKKGRKSSAGCHALFAILKSAQPITHITTPISAILTTSVLCLGRAASCRMTSATDRYVYRIVSCRCTYEPSDLNTTGN